MNRALRLLSVFVCAILFITSCQDDSTVSPGETTSLQGSILDAQGRGIPYAILEVHDSKPSIQAILSSDTTDEEGLFTLERVPSDMSTLYLRVQRPGFQSYSGKLGDLVRQMDHGRIRLALESNDSCCGRLDITVRGGQDSVGLQGVQVKVRQGGNLVSVALTDSLGKVSFQHLCPGTYNFRLAKSGYQVVEQNFVIEDCDSVNLNAYMQSGGNNNDSCCHGVATIIVRDSIGATLLSGATVKLWKNGALLTTLTTNVDGQVRFTGLCPGEYGLSILKEQYYGREYRFIVACSDTITQTRTLLAKTAGGDSCCSGVISFVVRDSLTNDIITGLTVKLWQGNQLKKTQTMTANGVGFANLCEGTYGISVSGERITPFEFEVHLDCDDTVNILKLVRRNDTCCNNRIYLIVRDSVTNAFISNATVKIAKNGAVIGSQITNMDGYVSFEELCQGTYTLSIQREGYSNTQINVTVSCNSNEERSVRLWSRQQQDSCCNGVVKVIVNDSLNNIVLSGVLVKLWQNNQMISSQTTGSNGYIYFTGLCSGTYALSLSRTQYQGGEISFQIGCDDTIAVTRRLLALGNNNDTCDTAILKVRVKDSTAAEGNWLEGVSVVIKRSGIVVAQGTTGVEGWYMRETLLAPAEYSVTFTKPGYISKTVAFRFSECKTLQETIRLVPE
jgi:protocatechuate 3,4-dioxygenase beta subunit